MSKADGNINPFRRVAEMYRSNPDMLSEHIDARNKMAEQLNEKIFAIVKTSPMLGMVETSESKEDVIKKLREGKSLDGEIKFDFDVTTKELLTQIRDENEKALRKAFPDLYLISDYEKEN